MRLTKEHIGTRVRLPNWSCFGSVIAIDGDFVWIRLDEEIRADTFDNKDNWIIEEPEKKPSDIIKERVNLCPGLGRCLSDMFRETIGAMDYTTKLLTILGEILDETAEK